MTPIVDGEGRLFGRVNLVDAICAVFLLALLPATYASLLLLRPSRPQIESVSRAEPNREDRRIANGIPIRMKLKVRGNHLTPGLRAQIGDVQAIGFTFETPLSADVIVGDVPLGTHDLVLFDGAREVARASRAVVVTAPPSAFVRIAGAFVQLERAAADGLKQGQRFEVDGQTAAEVLALGPVESDRQPINRDAQRIETPVAAAFRRSVILRVYCEPDPEKASCRIGANLIGDPATTTIDVPGTRPPIRMRIGDVGPDEAAHVATVRVRIASDPGVRDRVKPGDRDMRGEPVDERNATIVSVTAAGSLDIVTRVGVNRTRDGWRYKGQLIAPGQPFSFVTERYAIAGTVSDLTVDEQR